MRPIECSSTLRVVKSFLFQRIFCLLRFGYLIQLDLGRFEFRFLVSELLIKPGIFLVELLDTNLHLGRFGFGLLMEAPFSVELFLNLLDLRLRTWLRISLTPERIL